MTGGFSSRISSLYGYFVGDFLFGLYFILFAIIPMDFFYYEGCLFIFVGVILPFALFYDDLFALIFVKLV